MRFANYHIHTKFNNWKKLVLATELKWACHVFKSHQNETVKPKNQSLKEADEFYGGT